MIDDSTNPRTAHPGKADPDNQIQADSTNRQLVVHYIKNSDHRVISVSGMMVQLTPTGKMSLTPYSERCPIPQIVPLIIDGNNRATDDMDNATTKQGIVRQIDITMLIDMETVENIIDTVGKFLENFKRIKSQMGEIKQ